MQRSPIVCPSCGAEFDISETPTRSRRSRSAARSQPREAVAEKAPVAEAEEPEAAEETEEIHESSSEEGGDENYDMIEDVSELGEEEGFDVQGEEDEESR
jgi:hypothetical protein